MGGAAGVNLISSMLRTKFAAVFIGTSGVGVISSLSTMSNLIGAITGLGLQSSVVRAVVNATNNENSSYEISIIIKIINRLCMFTFLIGLIFLTVFRNFISNLTFDNVDFANEIPLLGVVALLANLSSSYTAVLQGLRRITDIAKINIISGIFGSTIAISCYFSLGIKGIIPGLIALVGIQFYFTWNLVNKINNKNINLSLIETFSRSSNVARTGLVFMWNNLLGSFAAYLIILIITKKIGIEAVGIYSAAFALSGVFVNFVLSAMGTDYYPRLTNISHDTYQMRKLVNEQTEIGLLLGVPGLIFTMTLAPWLIHIFYSQDFLPAVELLKWFLLGCLGRVISWPMGYIVIAMNNLKLLLLIAGIGEFFHVLLVYYFVDIYGLIGAAIAFPILLLITTLINLFYSWQSIKFRWSSKVIYMIFVFSFFLILVMNLDKILSEFSSFIAGIIISSFVLIYTCVHVLYITSLNTGLQNKLIKIFKK